MNGDLVLWAGDDDVEDDGILDDDEEYSDTDIDADEDEEEEDEDDDTSKTTTKTTTMTMTTMTTTKTTTRKRKTTTTRKTTKRKRPKTSGTTTMTTRRKKKRNERAAARPPGLDQGPRADGRALRSPAGAHARPRAAHRVRGGALPEHRRVLEPRHRDLHDPRRRLHARLRLLRGQDGASAASSRSRGAAPGRGRGRPHGAAPRRDHLGQPRRPAGRRGVVLCRLHPRDPGAHPGLRGGGADPRLQGKLGRPGRGLCRAARRPQPQHRDGAAAVPPGASRRPLRALPRAPAPIAGSGAPDQERHHGRPRRGVARDRGHHPRHPRLGHRRPHGGPVPASQPRSPAAAALLHSRRVREHQVVRAVAGLRPRRVGPARPQSSYHADEHVPVSGATRTGG